MNNQPTQLVFKSMRRLRHANREEQLADARKSPYFWWWSYLRLSKDYWWLCHRSSQICQDERLRKVRRDFGNVYSMPFDEWWLEFGCHLFAEQVALPSVRQIDLRRLDISPNTDDHIVLEIPLRLTERTITRQVLKLVREHENREVKRVSNARRPLCKLTGVRLDVLQIAQQVWQRHYETRFADTPVGIGQAKGSKTLYQIGLEFRLVKSCMPRPGDSIEIARKKVNGMKVGVSRMLNRANCLIANAEIGLFPCFDTVEQQKRWPRRNQAAFDEAITAGLWRPLFDANDVLTEP